MATVEVSMALVIHANISLKSYLDEERELA